MTKPVVVQQSPVQLAALAQEHNRQVAVSKASLQAYQTAKSLAAIRDTAAKKPAAVQLHLFTQESTK